MNGGQVNAAAFDGSGKYLAVAGSAGVVVAHGKEFAPLVLSATGVASNAAARTTPAAASWSANAAGVLVLTPAGAASYIVF